MAEDSQKSMIATYEFLKQDAKKSGWKLIRGAGWVCPACLQHAAKQIEGGDHA